jgi:aspartyl-tRNA(Asn)/glutamyl-tRNA(Gln) amidotransferase subunit A
MIDAPLRTLGRRLRERAIRAEAILEQAIGFHTASEGLLGAFKTWSPDLAMAEARAADALFAAGIDLGPLQGIPVSVKDVFGLAGLPIFAGAKRELPVSFSKEGPIVDALKHCVPVITGKTHTPEFAFGGIGRNSHWGTPRNPWDAKVHRVPGGSSSGAAVSLLQGTAVLALGSDTAGSVRVPASWTGNVGFKTTRGRWPTAGIVPQSRLFDSVGLLGRRVDDVALAAIALERNLPGLADGGSADPLPLEAGDIKIGIPAELLWNDCAPGIAEAVKAALDELARAGASLVSVKFPEANDAWAVFLQGGIIATELYTFLSEALPERLDELDPVVGPRVIAAKDVPASLFLARQRRIEQLAEAGAARLREVDVIVCPTVAIPPPTLDEVSFYDDYLARNFACLRNTAVVNYLGLCALTIPVGLDKSGLPVGMQLMAAGGSDRRLLDVGCAVERVIGDGRTRLGQAPLSPLSTGKPV